MLDGVHECTLPASLWTDFSAAMCDEERLRQRVLVRLERIRGCQRNVVRCKRRAAKRRIEHPLKRNLRSIDRDLLPVHDQFVAFDVD